ncbi:MAG: SWIM zinc finger family protein [Candidatus Bathyarchaeia archaeon]
MLGTVFKMDKSAKAVWVKVLNETPIRVRRRASSYLKRIKEVSAKEWLVWSREGAQYRVRLEKGNVTCSCPYSEREQGYCKHICAVAVHELTLVEVKPWLRRLEERL